MGVAKKVQEAGLIIGALGVIGFIGIVWLMIYGNLSGNLGFSDETLTITNESITLDDAGSTPTTLIGRNSISLSSVLVQNGTETVPSSNYTYSGGVFYNTSSEYGGVLVNVTSSASVNTLTEDRAEGVILNNTQGFGTFFGFSKTLFTIAAIVLLIFMLVGLLAIVMTIAKGKGNKSKGYSGY